MRLTPAEQIDREEWAEIICAAAVQHRRAKGLTARSRVLVKWPDTGRERAALQAVVSSRDSGVTLTAPPVPKP